MVPPSLSRVDRLSLRWWFYLLVTLLLFSPAYTSQAYNPADTPQLVIAVLSNPLAYAVPALFPLFKLIPLALIIGVIFWPALASRWFYGWAGVNLVIMAVFQDMADTATYGFAVLVGNLFVYGLVGLLWIRTAFSPAGGTLNLSTRLPIWRYWVLAPALLAFWYPVSMASGIPLPNFAPIGLLANEAGLTFCMMLPVYLAVLTLTQPRANRTVMRISGFVGLFTGLLNVVEFILIPVYGPWMATMHLPLLLISIYTFGLSLRKEGR